MLNHIALNINYKEDIQEFYIDLLGFDLKYQYYLDEDKSLYLFEIEGKAEVFVLKRKDIKLELFLNNRRENNIYSHVCLNVDNNDMLRKEYYTEIGYKVKHIPREEKVDLLFVQDKSGNFFEIK